MNVSLAQQISLAKLVEIEPTPEIVTVDLPKEDPTSKPNLALYFSPHSTIQ